MIVGDGGEIALDQLDAVIEHREPAFAFVAGEEQIQRGASRMVVWVDLKKEPGER